MRSCSIVPPLLDFKFERSPTSASKVSHCNKDPSADRAFCNHKETVPKGSVIIASKLIRVGKLGSAEVEHPNFNSYLKVLQAALFLSTWSFSTVTKSLQASPSYFSQQKFWTEAGPHFEISLTTAQHYPCNFSFFCSILGSLALFRTSFTLRVFLAGTVLYPSMLK